jgi:hypothetical protein
MLCMLDMDLQVITSSIKHYTYTITLYYFTHFRYTKIISFFLFYIPMNEEWPFLKQTRIVLFTLIIFTF